jgi:hypothetical protein
MADGLIALRLSKQTATGTDKKSRRNSGAISKFLNPKDAMRYKAGRKGIESTFNLGKR